MVMIWTIFLIVFLIFSLFYLVFVFSLISGINRLKAGENSEFYKVSIIIPARNEEKNIANCLDSIVDIGYPADKWEVIVVDDRSGDGTFRIAKSYEDKILNYKVLRIKDKTPSPKKHALETAFKEASGDIIFTTDADCTVQKEWISEMVNYFNAGTGMVIGFSPLLPRNSSLLSSFQYIDSISLGGLAAGGVGLGFPLTCTGRNLAFRKEIFNEIGGYGEFRSYISGDDDLLMHVMGRRSKLKIAYASAHKSVVGSLPGEKFGNFINSRLRHASKFSFYPFYVKLVSVFLYLYNLLVLAAIAGIFFVSIKVWIVIISLLIKYISDYSLIRNTRIKFGIRENRRYFPLIFLLHSIYIVFFGLLGLRKKFEWKE